MDEDESAAIDLRANLIECENIINLMDHVDRKVDVDFSDKIVKCIERLELLTRQVSQLSMFSDNEQYAELPASNLQFLLLPAYLGYAFTQKQYKSDPSSRMDDLKHAEVYFRDFLNRIKNYGIIDEQWLRSCHASDVLLASGDEESADAAVATDPAAIRAAKMDRYKQEKSIEAELLKLRRVQKSVETDDHLMQQISLALIRLWTVKAIGELDSIRQEKPLLKTMIEGSNDGASTASAAPSKHKFRPFTIISREQAQRQVFGLGYPSAPTVTVNDWYDGMVRDGHFPAAGAQKSTVPTERDDDNDSTDHEDDDDDDETRRKRLQNMDEYKDDHRRGWGNTKNKG